MPSYIHHCKIALTLHFVRKRALSHGEKGGAIYYASFPMFIEMFACVVQNSKRLMPIQAKVCAMLYARPP